MPKHQQPPNLIAGHWYEGLRFVSPQAVKLLARIIEMAHSGRGQARSKDAAYLPELHESCGLGVEEMYAMLEELRAAELIQLEGDYPFEDAKIAHASVAEEIRSASARRSVSLSETLMELRSRQ